MRQTDFLPSSLVFDYSFYFIRSKWSSRLGLFIFRFPRFPILTIVASHHMVSPSPRKRQEMVAGGDLLLLEEGGEGDLLLLKDGGE